MSLLELLNKNLFGQQTTHLNDRLDQTALETDPYPYFEVQNLFTNRFYNFMKNSMPPGDSLPTLKSTGLVPAGYSDNRKVLPIKDYTRGHDFLFKVVREDKTRKDILSIYRWMSDTMMPALAKKLGITIPLYYLDELLYIEDSEGYKLGPHTDLSTKIFSVLIYMPDDLSLAACGTNILVPKVAGFTDSNNNSQREEAFNIVKTSKFIPNNTLVFKRTDNSFHSVTRVQSKVPRKLMLFNVKV